MDKRPCINIYSNVWNKHSVGVNAQVAVLLPYITNIYTVQIFFHWASVNSYGALHTSICLLASTKANEILFRQ